MEEGLYYHVLVACVSLDYHSHWQNSDVTVAQSPKYSPCRGEESKLKEESIRWDPFLVKSSDSNGFWPCDKMTKVVFVN